LFPSFEFLNNFGFASSLRFQATARQAAFAQSSYIATGRISFFVFRILQIKECHPLHQPQCRLESLRYGRQECLRYNKAINLPLPFNSNFRSQFSSRRSLPLHSFGHSFF